MGETLKILEEILAAETLILEQLIEVNCGLANVASVDVGQVARAVERRAMLMAALDECEGRAAPLRACTSLTPRQFSLAEKLKSLCAAVEETEQKALLNLAGELARLKTDAFAIDRGLAGLSRYQGPVSHLSRFTDRTG